IGASDYNIYIMDPESLVIKQQITQAHSNSVFTAKYSPNGQFIVSAGRDAMLKVWERNTLELISEKPAHWFTINSLTFDPNGKWMATASRDKTIKVWDLENWELLKVLEPVRDKAHVNSVNDLLWSEYDDVLISCSDDRSLILWKVNAIKNSNT
ncbi:MAG: WD40 repeat domain-containing protein, partial [Bacteroidota bacterium]